MQQNYTVIVAMYATSCTYPVRILLFPSNFMFRTGVHLLNHITKHGYIPGEYFSRGKIFL